MLLDNPFDLGVDFIPLDIESFGTSRPTTTEFTSSLEFTWWPLALATTTPLTKVGSW